MRLGTPLATMEHDCTRTSVGVHRPAMTKARGAQVLRKPDAIALTEAFSRRGAAPSLRTSGQAGTGGGAPAAPAAAALAAANVGQVCLAHRLSLSQTNPFVPATETV